MLNTVYTNAHQSARPLREADVAMPFTATPTTRLVVALTTRPTRLLQRDRTEATLELAAREHDYT